MSSDTHADTLRGLHVRQLGRLRAQMAGALSLVRPHSPAEAAALAQAWLALGELAEALHALQAHAEARAGGRPREDRQAHAAAEAGDRPAGPRRYQEGST